MRQVIPCLLLVISINDHEGGICLKFFVCSYVFDGKPPELKSGELVKRAEKRAEAEKELAQAQEQGMCMYVYMDNKQLA